MDKTIQTAAQRVKGRVDSLGRPPIVSGHQPCYHAYLPTVAKLAASDVFLVADDLPFSRSLFQHRQQFVVGTEPIWATVPVERSNGRASIAQKVIRQDETWRAEHRRTIETSLVKAPYFDVIAEALESVYSRSWDSLVALTQALWSQLVGWFAPDACSVLSSEFGQTQAQGKGRRIAYELSKVASGGTYLAGAGAKYLQEATTGVRRHLDEIHDVGFSAEVISLDSRRFAHHTSLPPSSPAISLVAYEGRDARNILVDSISRVELR